MNIETWLPVLWTGIVALAVVIYVILDGFDLGVGILFPWFSEEQDRTIMLNTIAPVWDGNATWLIFGGACLYAAFPIAYSSLLPILYMPIMLMLAALIFRGIAFEFRYKSHEHRYFWDMAFAGGSLVVAFAQGVILGTFIQGFKPTENIMSTTFYEWFNPFSFTIGIAVMVGYALLGSTWLIVKTTDSLQQRMFPIAKSCLIGVGIFILYASIFTPLVDPYVLERWFSYPNIILLSPLPMATMVTGYLTWHYLNQKNERNPFILSILLFCFPLVGFVISIWPYIVPHHITIWQAASPVSSQLFILFGAVILLPVLLGYTLYAYRVFAGKVTSETDHHY